MFRYRGFSLTIDSELELRGLPAAEGEPDVLVRFGEVPRAKPRISLDDHLGFNTIGGMFRIRHGREILIDPLPHAEEDLLRTLVMGRMMAFLLRQRGWLPLHASGVMIDGRAVLFMGRSGSGKSTLAAAFHTRRYEVIADDVAAVRLASEHGPVALPAGSRVRLGGNPPPVLGSSGFTQKGTFQWDKYTFDLTGEDRPNPVPVARVYVLDFAETARLAPVSPTEAVALLSRNSFAKQHRMDKATQCAHLRDCSAIAREVPVRRLTRRNSLTDLIEGVRLVEGDLAD